jgi:molybdopterin-biosynthesis enzyme MoeA-like protein
MLPGVPSFLRHQFERITGLLAGAPYHLACLYFRWGEDQLAVPLGAVAESHASVEVGSYPRFDAAEYRVRVPVEGRDRAAVHAAARAILAEVPGAAVVRVEGLDS